MRKQKKNQLSILVNSIGLVLLLVILIYNESFVVVGLVGSVILWMISGLLQISMGQS
ncbi:MAG: hypothetical protein JSV04_12000 [Candidatus Heimdallarchaeota archaeon]|nr:MAG: hypothetical protein JSV04_12000 [Candidatus Heimdallarchaeota archaeon]